MTKMGNLGLNRRFEKKKGIVRRENVIEAFAAGEKPCLVCGKGMKVSVGQIVNSHRECRTKARKRRMVYGK